MKLALIIFVALASSACSFPNDNNRRSRLTTLDLSNDLTEKWINKTTLPIQGRGVILSQNGRNIVENFINHIPCGWPKAGIPPLAPYAKKEIDFEFKKSIVKLSQKFEYFRVDGLDIILIERLKVGYILRKSVKFNFILPKVVISGKYFTDILIDAMKKYGISLKYEGKGAFEIILKNIDLLGSFKYEMPMFFGHTYIYNFDISASLGNVVSQIGGIGGIGKLNRLLNEKIGEIVVHIVNSNQEEISEKLKVVLASFINDKLKNRNMWKFFKSQFGKKGKICYPPPFPW